MHSLRKLAVAPLAAASALLLAGACSVQPPGTAAPQGPASSSQTNPPGGSSAGAPTGAPPPGAGVAFDSVHVAEVLGPAVGELIVNTGGGTAEGSGFVVSVQGSTSYMVTNNHVVSGANRVQVLMPDGRHFLADVQGTDPIEDLAVVRIADRLPVANFADSTKVRVGQPVVAIGSPLGQQGSVTSGIISALHRTISAGGGRGGASESLPDVLQTDAPINPGNSGGPLADANGNVVGVNTAASNGANSIGFAIPSLVAKRIADALIAGRKPGHPYVGVCYSTVEDALAAGQDVKGYGVVVSRALPDTPADRAGIRSGDVIEKVDGVDLNNGQTLGGVLQLHNPGDRVRMTVVRGSGSTDLDVTLGDRPATSASC